MSVFITALAAFACGVLAAYINQLITRSVLKGGRVGFAAAFRALVTSVFMAILFLIGAKTELDLYALLIGGALGATCGMILFTVLMLNKGSGASGGEEGRTNG